MFWSWEGWAAVEAIAVVLALIAAGYAVRFEMRADKRLADELERTNDERVSAQAAAVAVWPSGGYVPNPETAPRNIAYPSATLKNSSALPITNVWLLIREQEGDQTSESYFAPMMHVVEPGEAKIYDVPKDKQFGDTARPVAASALILRFTDANGRVWERDGAGTLTRR